MDERAKKLRKITQRMISEVERLRRIKFGKVAVTHGAYKTPEYGAWLAMRARCMNPNNPAYPHYGGRGIAICERWNDFEAFLADMGKKPNPKLWLERRDNSKGYSPENCYWATTKEQLSNTRRTVRVELFGEVMCLKDWALRLGLPYRAVQSRIRKNWTPAKALITPIMTQYRKKK